MGFLKRILCEGELKEGRNEILQIGGEQDPDSGKEGALRIDRDRLKFAAHIATFLQLCNTFEAAPKYRVEATLKS